MTNDFLTIDRDKARDYLNEILSECDEPYCSPCTDKELDVFIEHIEIYAFGERMSEDYFQWLDSERGA